MSVLDVSSAKLERVQDFIRFLEGGALADALMSLFVGYEQRGTKIEHLKEKVARSLERQQESP